MAALVLGIFHQSSGSTAAVRLLLGIIGAVALAAAVVTARVLVDTRRTLERLKQDHQACEQEHEHLAAVSAISEAVNSSLDLDTVLNQALDRALEVMGLESGDIRLVEGDKLLLTAARRVSSGFLDAEREIPLGQCACGKAAVSGQLIAIENVDAAPSLASTPCACEQFASVLSVPVRTADRVVGVIHGASRSPRKFEDGERQLLVAIGHQVGVAIEKAQLHGELATLNRRLETRVAERTEELAVAKEALAQKADALHQMLVEERRIEEKTRARIAHDLHDGVQQLIIGAMFEAQAARDSLGSRPEAGLAKIGEVQKLLRRIEGEMRAAIYNLRPVALDAHGLVPALRECTAAFEEMTGIPCPLIVTGTPRRFDADAEVAAFRIVQEALNNTEAHARASHVQVRVCFEESALYVTIVDDGQGFDLAGVAAQPRSHLGLIGMRERAESIGGNIEIRSEAGMGAEVRLVIPAGGTGADRDLSRDMEEAE